MNRSEEKFLCHIRDIYRSITSFELIFEKKYDICLNEGMLLCSLKENIQSSSQLAEILGLSHSNTSKVIKSAEAKGLINRNIGQDDKRQMYFNLNKEGKKVLSQIKCKGLVLPEILQPVLGHCDEE